MIKLHTLFFILFTCGSFSYQIEAKNHDGTCQQHRNYLSEIKTPTTRGTIHYDTKGRAHIVPAPPRN